MFYTVYSGLDWNWWKSQDNFCCALFDVEDSACYCFQHVIPEFVDLTIVLLGTELQKVGETGEISLGDLDLWNAILIRAAEIMPFYSGSGTHLTGSQYSHSVYKLQCINMHDNYIC